MLEYPFLRREFLGALEDSNCVCRETGWQPHHMKLTRESGRFFMPTYLKNHSWGEYVFDWSWAEAYERSGIPYYPKLISAIPFTPATGPRVARKGISLDAGTCLQLVEKTKALAGELQASSWHLLFPQQAELEMFKQAGLLCRTGVQFHWFNRDYSEFDDFLGALNSRKRKMINRERRKIAEQNLQIKRYEGARISSELWDFFYLVYTRTYLKRSGVAGYLNRDFFDQVATRMPEQIAMAVAFENDQPVACALYFFDDQTLFGRYWGSRGEFEHLHFELCYYQGIELAIAKRLRKFDAGAQGEHKITRGFEPITTHSLHWIANPQFAAAIADFLNQEQQRNLRYIDQVRPLLPYRATD